MAYSTSLNFSAATSVLSGTLTFAAPVTIPPTASTTVADIVISAYADGAQANAGAYFAQGRSDGSGNWNLSTNALPAGSHTIAVMADYGSAVLASTTVTTSGGAIGDGSGTRRDLRTNNAPRS